MPESELLFVIVDQFTGVEIEREWYPADQFSPGDTFENDDVIGTISEIIVENEETRRVYLVEEM